MFIFHLRAVYMQQKSINIDKIHSNKYSHIDNGMQFLQAT